MGFGMFDSDRYDENGNYNEDGHGDRSMFGSVFGLKMGTWRGLQKCPEEKKSKMRDQIPWNKGKKGVQKCSEETRSKMRGRIPWNKGKKTPAETREKQRLKKLRKHKIEGKQYREFKLV